ncbi:MAG: MFS transporter [Chloroflexi bacterium RBG_16_54_11]|nr:MAG: MFS transporter [Chloroflexi bacterium RBG_16_54_11]
MSLKYPNYRLWFFGQLVSLIGTWTQATAQGYLIYQLTKSPAYLGYVSFAAGLPSWIFTLYAGAIADRVPRRKLMVITQCSMLVWASILAVLTFSHVVQWWHILILAFLMGISNAFDAPARQAFVLEMVTREDLTNAIALNSTMFTSAVVLGPAIGGLLYAWVGPGWCFTINAISFLAVIMALLLMKLKPVSVPRPRTNPWSDVREGMNYVARTPAIRMLITNLFVITLFGMGVATLIPAWAVEVLKGDASTNGFLLASRGLGSLIGALAIASLGRFRFRGRLWTASSLLMPIMMIWFAYMRWLPMSLLAMAGVGLTFMIVINLSNALVQTRIPDEMRGRVMGIFTLTFFGAMPIGSLITGWVAARIGEPVTVTISALILFAFTIFVYWRLPAMRAME